MSELLALGGLEAQKNATNSFLKTSLKALIGRIEFKKN